MYVYDNNSTDDTAATAAVVSKVFRTFDWGEAAHGTGSSGDGTSQLLVLQQVDVQVAFGRPGGASNVT
jgi:hypothetical protein